VRLAEITKIFAEVFGTSPFRAQRSPVERFRIVLGSQAAWYDGPGKEALLAKLDGRFVHEYIDAAAIAPYFGYAGDGADLSSKPLDQLWDKVRRSVQDYAASTSILAKWVTEARRYGLVLLAYEGGQHLTESFGSNPNQDATIVSVAGTRVTVRGLSASTDYTGKYATPVRHVARGTTVRIVSGTTTANGDGTLELSAPLPAQDLTFPWRLRIQHLVHANQYLLNSQPPMEEIYSNYLSIWRSYGPTTREFVHFQNASNWGHYGSWGANYSVYQREDTPKMKALKAAASQWPWWIPTPTPTPTPTMGPPEPPVALRLATPTP
jgi:hypothetical protein